MMHDKLFSHAGYVYAEFYACLVKAIRTLKELKNIQMKKIISALITVVAGLFVTAQSQSPLIDKDATKETKALYTNLKLLAENHILFGHQHATEYGHGWSGDENRSDVQSVTGSHPAVIGVDFSGLSGEPLAQIEANKKHLIKIIADTYNRGGVTTVAWHFNNPLSNTSFYWNDSTAKAAVKYLIPGGSANELYKSILKNLAFVANNTKGKDGKLVPMIFRPYHEFDGDWFWWGKSHSTVEDFISLWKFTVSYLRDSLKVHNFIYAFSPDNRFDNEAQFLERYPGDGWVDMVGMDNYGDFGRDGKYDLEAGYKKLKIVSDYAIRSGKLAAFTETGLESIADSSWWTKSLLQTLKRSNLKLSYVLVWRNDIKSPTHFYAPYPGHKSEKDFLKFYNDDYTLFENDLPDMYAAIKPALKKPVTQHGSLQVKGSQLLDKNGSPVVLHGMSFGWHNWWPRFYNAGVVKELKTKWNCTVLRAAMGVEPKGGYINDPATAVKLVENVIDACIENGIYVIVDWHSHNIKTDSAKIFFDYISKKYGKYPNIIYEVFNEPVKQSWDSIKMYSEEIIKTIRKNDRNNIILVGSPHWDQDVHIAADDPIQGFSNLMYTLHFYAATHKKQLRDRTDYALKKGLPIFVSECAGMEASGDGLIDHYEWNEWVKWMDERKVSWVAWSIADKDETCSVLNKSAASEGNWKINDIKEWGKIVKKYLKKNK